MASNALTIEGDFINLLNSLLRLFSVRCNFWKSQIKF